MAKSLLTKLLLVVLLPALLVSMLTAGFMSYARLKRLTDDFLAQQQDTIALYADVVSTPVWQFDRKTLQGIVDNLARHPDVRRLAILDEEGQPLAMIGDAPSPKGQAPPGALQVVRPIVHRDRDGALQQIGTFQATFSDARIRANVRGEILFLLLICLVLLVTQAISVVLAFRVMLKRPLDQLISTIRESERTGRSVTVQFHSQDELGVVVRAYNRMQRKLDTNTLRLETLYNQTPGLLFSLDTEGHFISVSDFFCTATGKSRETLIGTSVFDLVAPDQRDGFETAALPALREGKRLKSQQVEIQAGRAGTRTYYLVNSIPEYDTQRGLVGSICVMTDVSEQVRVREILSHQANYDTVTLLPNRNLMNKMLRSAISRAQRCGSKIALVFMDLDRFKWINDSHGHSTGDHLLRSVAQRLQATLRENETAARFGGDEFVLLMEHLDHPDQAIPPVTRVLNALAAPFHIGGQTLFTTASLGVAFYPDDAEDPELLLRYADSAMYEAKEAGRNAYQLYSAHLDNAAKTRLQIASQVLSAASEDRLLLHFQPILAASSGEIEAYEALLRIRDAETGGLIPPGQFVPIAEDLGMIKEMGYWVLKEVLARLADWPHASGFPEPKYVSINVSYVQIFDPEFAAMVSSLLHEYGVPPLRLVLELTESGLIDTTGSNVELINKLIATGCPLSIDDFGTGYSSLATLRRIPFSTLKIDREFVMGVERRGDEFALAKTLVAIADTLGLAVVVEGIETAETESVVKEMFRSWDNVSFQGYHYSRPQEIPRSLPGESAGAA